MQQIAYEYVQGSLAHGEVKLEKNSNTAQAISTLDKPDYHDRKETRGDGPTRTFHYGGPNNSLQGLLTSYTDFNGKTTTLGYGGRIALFFTSVLDANNHATSYDRNYLGIITRVTLGLHCFLGQYARVNLV